MADVRFVYRLTGVGWAEAELEIGGRSARLTASYLGDALGDLLRGALALVHGAPRVEVSWVEEPGEFTWTLTSRGDGSVDVRIVRLHLRAEESVAGVSTDTGHEVLAGSCDRHEFCAVIARAAQAVLDEYGLEGYKERWDQFDFPSEPPAELLALD